MKFFNINIFSPINNIIHVSQDIIDVTKSRDALNTQSPIIISCLTNLERSSLVALTVTCILALESDMPVIISKIYLKKNIFFPMILEFLNFI